LDGGHLPSRFLQIVWLQTGAFGEAREHSRPDLLTFVKCEDEIGPSLPLKNAM
jgi:hypothetical protein